MRSTDKLLAKLVTVILTGVALTACGSSGENALPKISIDGTRAHEYTTLGELAQDATAVVVAVPTGKEHAKPLPKDYGPADAAPTPYVQLRVIKVLSGDLQPGMIDLVSPGLDERTGKQALRAGGPYLLYITPAMYAANDPAGGYVVVGGPAGAYGATSSNAKDFNRIDTESVKLPAKITLGATDVPAAALTEQEALAQGPQ